MRGTVKFAEVPRAPGMIEDQFALEIAQFFLRLRLRDHYLNISFAVVSAATRRSTSSWLLYNASDARAVPGTP